MELKKIIDAIDGNYGLVVKDENGNYIETVLVNYCDDFKTFVENLEKSKKIAERKDLVIETIMISECTNGNAIIICLEED